MSFLFFLQKEVNWTDKIVLALLDEQMFPSIIIRVTFLSISYKYTVGKLKDDNNVIKEYYFSLFTRGKLVYGHTISILFKINLLTTRFAEL